MCGNVGVLLYVCDTGCLCLYSYFFFHPEINKYIYTFT